MKPILSPSLLSADFSRLGEEVRLIDKAGAEFVHIDVMDGCFVPNISFGPVVIKSIRKCTERTFDVHLMIDEPIRYLDDYKDAGADFITVHYEACRHLHRTVSAIHERGMKASAALNPATPCEVLTDIMPDLDMILLMSVNPGFGGQKFIQHTTDKIRRLRLLMNGLGLSLPIEVDGGITVENVSGILEAGADVIVAGSSVFKGDPECNVRTFRKIMSGHSLKR